MADVFISYSQRAPEPTQTLASALIEQGIDAWFDVNLLPGEAFGKVLDGEIDCAKAVITIWSRPALTSIWVRAESERALGQKKLICVRMPDVNAADLPSPFNTLHTPLVTDIDAIVGALAARGIRKGKASISGLQAEHGTMGEAAIAWHSVKDSTNAWEIETFLEVYYAAAFYRLLATRRLALLKAPPAVSAPSRPQPVVQPAVPMPKAGDVFLRIEAGMHTASIRRISLTADGRMMATASHDKTVRLWSLPDGKLTRVLRPPIGPGNDGKVFAVALAPDGRWVASGGWDAAWAASERMYVTIFDTTTGAVVTRLGPLSTTTIDLEVSPSGDRLAAGLANNGVRVWETKGWRDVVEDRDYLDSVYGLSFAMDGRLAATSYDGHIRIYSADGRLAKKTRAPGGAQPFGIAFSPDGARLAVGYRDSTRVDVLSGQTLAHLFSPDTIGVNGGDLSSVAWSADNTRLVAGGTYGKTNSSILAWADGGKDKRQTFLGPDSTVMSLAAWGRGFAFGASDPAFGICDSDGKRLLFRGRPMADMRRRPGEQFLISDYGTQVRFGISDWTSDPWLFDLATLKLTPSVAAPAGLQSTNITGLPVTDWQDASEPKLYGRILPLDQHEYAQSLAIAPDAQTFVLGTEWNLRRFDKDGKQLWEKSVPAPAWGVNLAREGRLLLAAYGDGTIRWHRAADGEELLALFIHVPDDPKADKRWVLWTPEGYYTASPGGEDLIGWHVNRGDDQAADFYPAETFRSTFHRPDLIAKALDKV